MKKLLTTAAVCGLVVAANPAMADIDLELGGHFKGYVVYTDQDDDSAFAGEARDFDILRETEIHFGGETTLDNGLTVGAQIEAETDRENSNDSFDVEESYLYFSSGWGRVNFGAEDGAAYLLQVEAPSADDNIDGIRAEIFPVNYTAAESTAGGLAIAHDYDQNPTGATDKITYLSPVMSGFQVGLTYVPDVADGSTATLGNLDDINDAAGSAYEAALRYEGQFSNVGVTLGAGYSMVDLEADTDTTGNEDDRKVWNVGLDLDFGPFGVGVAYKEDNYFKVPTVANGDEETLVVGVDYTTGPFKIGASYYDQENTADILGNTGANTSGVDTKRYTGGVTYTYGPGMTFRGSISHINHDNVAAVDTGDEIEATSVLIGTVVKF